MIPVSRQCGVVAVPVYDAPSLIDRLGEIEKDLSIIESRLPALKALKQEPEIYTQGRIFHYDWIRTLLVDLYNFLRNPSEREKEAALLFTSNGDLVPAPMPTEGESAKIKSLIQRAKAIKEIAPVQMSTENYYEHILNVRDEAAKVQLVFNILFDIHASIIEHNIKVQGLRCSVTRVIVAGLRLMLPDITCAITRINLDLNHLPADRSTLDHKCLLLSNVDKVIQVCYGILDDIIESLPRPTRLDIEDPSRISHKSVLDQEIAWFFQDREKICQATYAVHEKFKKIASKLTEGVSFPKEVITPFARQDRLHLLIY